MASVSQVIAAKMRRDGVSRIQAVRELVNSGTLHREDGVLRTRGSTSTSGKARVEWEKRKQLKK